MTRLATAAVLAPVLWALICWAPPGVFHAAALAVTGLALHECYRMLEAWGRRPFKAIGLLAGLSLVWSFAGLPPRLETALPLVAMVAVTAAVAMWRRDEPAVMLATSVATQFPVLLVGLNLAFLSRLRGLPGEDGQDLLLLLFLCVILADTAAFYVGTRFGRRRLAPRLSPRKSWEGAIGGLAAAVVAGLIAHVWFYQRLPIGHAVVVGLLLGLAGMVGDLAESMLKRAVGVKDSSTLLPGHGGMLDRTDSLLFAAPLLYYYYRAFLGSG